MHWWWSLNDISKGKNEERSTKSSVSRSGGRNTSSNLCYLSLFPISLLDNLTSASYFRYLILGLLEEENAYGFEHPKEHSDETLRGFDDPYRTPFLWLYQILFWETELTLKDAAARRRVRRHLPYRLITSSIFAMCEKWTKRLWKFRNTMFSLEE